MQFNKTDTLPDWSYTEQNGLVTFESKELKVKDSVLVMDWEKCVKDLNIDVNNPVSVYDNLKNICEYFRGK